MKVMAHRGYSGVYPENTMLSFREAVKVGCDAIEMDVHETRDGRLVVIHDERLDRTTDGTGRICEHTFDELRQGNRFQGLVEGLDARQSALGQEGDRVGHGGFQGGTQRFATPLTLGIASPHRSQLADRPLVRQMLTRVILRRMTPNAGWAGGPPQRPPSSSNNSR